MDETLTAIVPIKGTSERVTGKNMRLFAGKPLMHYILTTLEQVHAITCISVNTDSTAVAEYARQFSKVVLHERPEHLCGHHVPMNSIIEYELSMLDGEHFLQTHVTNPLLTAPTVQRAIAAYQKSAVKEHTLFSVLEHRSRFFDHAQKPLNHDPRVLQNTQDLAPIYEENSCLYLFSRRTFVTGGNNRLGTHASLFPMSKVESQDIDTEEDLFMAEQMWKAINIGSAR